MLSESSELSQLSELIELPEVFSSMEKALLCCRWENKIFQGETTLHNSQGAEYVDGKGTGVRGIIVSWGTQTTTLPSLSPEESQSSVTCSPNDKSRPSPMALAV